MSEIFPDISCSKDICQSAGIKSVPEVIDILNPRQFNFVKNLLPVCHRHPAPRSNEVNKTIRAIDNGMLTNGPYSVYEDRHGEGIDSANQLMNRILLEEK